MPALVILSLYDTNYQSGGYILTGNQKIRKFNPRDLSVKEILLNGVDAGYIIYNKYKHLLYFLTDNRIIILDKDLNVLKAKTLPSYSFGGYRSVILSNSHLITVVGKNLLEYNEDLELIHTYAIPNTLFFPHIVIDSNDNIFTTCYDYATDPKPKVQLYKITIGDVLTHNQDYTLDQIHWSKTQQGILVGCPELDKVEVWNMSGQHETHYLAEVNTSYRGPLLLRVYDKRGIVKSIKVYLDN